MFDSQNDPLRLELTDLNTKVKEAMEERKAWMDEHMQNFARWPIGVELYVKSTGEHIGQLVSYSRYHGDRISEYDTSMDIIYNIRAPHANYIRNTSGDRSISPFLIGTKEERKEWLIQQANMIR